MTDTPQTTPETKPAKPSSPIRPYYRRRQRRLLLVSIALPALALAAFLTFMALRNQSIYFYPPIDLPTAEALAGREIRLGGMVVDGSLKPGDDVKVTFEITDYHKTVLVEYNDLLPPLFRDGQGVIVQGTLKSDGHFIASEVMAKHDENYMPPEVADALKKNPPPSE